MVMYPPGSRNIWKLGEGSTVCIFPPSIPTCCWPVKSQTKNGCRNLWPPQPLTGKISGKGHHGKGDGPWIDLLQVLNKLYIVLIVSFVYVNLKN